MRWLTIASVALLLFAGGAAGQSISVGSTVQLVERDKDIPAHPGPGDNHVPFRFTSGTQASVLAIDAATSWVEIRGARTDGGTDTGWIVQKYIAGMSTSTDVTQGPLSWCPPKGSQDPHFSGRLRIATWNLGNLHSQDGESIFTGNRPSVTREAVDYDRIRCYVRLFDPDILAVQEVDGTAALQRIVDTDVYDTHVSNRPQGSLNGMQNIGFAFKRGLFIQSRPTFSDLDVSGSGRLRHGARIDLTHNGKTILLMSVHLKSGCFSNGSSGSACDTLSNQIPMLEGWIDDAAQAPNAFIVLGDFNRRFNLDGDLVWAELDDLQPANSDLKTVTENMPISCRDNEFTEFIDHIVLVKRASEWFDHTSFRHITYRQADKDVWDKISDHCPVAVDLWVN